MDMVDFNPIEESEEDHNLQDYFPEKVPYHLQHLIEYRVKLLLKNDELFISGETQVVFFFTGLFYTSTPLSKI